MVPLWRDYTYLDLAAALELPVVIVARPGLGTINHTLLTIAALKERGLEDIGDRDSIMRRTKKTGLAETTSPGVIERISRGNDLGNTGHTDRVNSARSWNISIKNPSDQTRGVLLRLASVSNRSGFQSTGFFGPKLLT